jgi:hypothetical protein
MEILQYGAPYLFTRSVIPPPADLLRDRELLSGRKIHLRTLAPSWFYDEADLGWLQETLSEGLTRFIREDGIRGLTLDFAFEAFPEEMPRCEHSASLSWQTLARSLDGIRKVYT